VSIRIKFAPLTTNGRRAKNEEEKSKAVAAKSAKMSAVNKAVEMLKKLQAQVKDEGEKEAKLYNKFACWCRDSTEEKSQAIRDGQDEQGMLGGNIENSRARRDELDGMIDMAEEDIKSLEDHMKEERNTRSKAKSVFDANIADLTGAIEGLDGAMRALKASKTPSFAQLQSIRSAIKFGQALGKQSANRAAAVFSKEDPAYAAPANEVQMESYKFKSDGVIETLEGLRKDFVLTKNQIDDEEVASIRDHESNMQMFTSAQKRRSADLRKAQKEKGEVNDELATLNQRMSTVSATLLDDKEYLSEMSSMCEKKAKTYYQRTRARTEELQALTEAISIVSETIADQTKASTIRFAQTGVNIGLAKVVAASPHAMEAIEAEAEDADGAPSFVQQSLTKSNLRLSSSIAGRPSISVDKDRTTAIANMLRDRGQAIKSTRLTALATQITGDPLAKVKVLIQSLIERLLQEAANEANQKGWCDKALSDGRQKRDYAAEEIRSLNGKMGKLEARIKRLVEQIHLLEKELEKLHDEQFQAEEVRHEEHVENEVTVTEAREGLEALNMVIDVLDKFYKTQAKNTVDLSLEQGSPVDDAPDAGFDIGEAYTGSQGASTGILGMLDVMKSDFERTISETEKAEEEARQEHLKFMTESQKSIAQKSEAHHQSLNQEGDARGEYSEAQQKLRTESDTLDTAIAELLELQPACVNTGMSYKERVARREDEIESLKKALCIFENYGPNGIDDSC